MTAAVNTPKPRNTTKSNRHMTLLSFLIVQLVCAVFFVADATEDVWEEGLSGYTLLEAAVSIALIAGVIFGGIEMRRAIDRNKRAESALSAASGALADVIKTRFDDWSLTAAESDVALLAIKGFEVNEIAKFRGTAEGTIRAQLTRIYEKAGVTSRIQLMSLFLDDLIETPMLEKQI